MDNNTVIEPLDLLIGKYLSGNSTQEEAEELLHWVNLSDENQKYFSHYKYVWLQAEQRPEGHTTHNKWEQLQIRIEQREEELVSEKKPERNIRWLSIAAVFITLIGVAAFFFYSKLNHKHSLELTENVINVPYGSKLYITLPDNSKVWINAGSKVVYDNKFGLDNRNIKIEGEAYFEVAKNPRLPFVVYAGKVAIRALGTAFNVKAYPEDHKVVTTLVHGSVEVKKEGEAKQILLKPSEKITISNVEEVSLEKEESQELLTRIETRQLKTIEITKNVTLSKEIDIEKETAWKDGKLIFNQEPLETLVVQLMRKYDVSFEFENSKLKAFRFTGTFKDLTLEQIMDAIKFSSPIDYEISEKKVLLKNKRE